MKHERADFRAKKADFRPERAGGDERTNKWTNKQTKVPCVLQDFVPFGAAALLTSKAAIKYDTAGQGYR